MYNVKIFRYPAGWQIRMYNQIVGYHDKPDRYFQKPDDYIYFPMWDGSQQEYVYERIPGSVRFDRDMWWNPFEMREDRAPVEYDEALIAAKKERSISSSMNRTVNAVYQIARSNLWDWFVTLTFNPDLVDSFDYGIVVEKLTNWLSNCRRICPDMGYLIVPEKHVSGRYHFHGLFKDCDDLGFVDSGKRDRKGNVIYNIGKYRLGFTTATRIVDQARVTKYIAKYINKDLCSVSFGRRRYWFLSEPPGA